MCKGLRQEEINNKYLSGAPVSQGSHLFWEYFKEYSSLCLMELTFEHILTRMGMF